MRLGRELATRDSLGSDEPSPTNHIIPWSGKIPSLTYREPDVRECSDLWQIDIHDAVKLSLETSLESYEILNEVGTTEGFFGLGRSNSPGIGCPWLLSTNYIIQKPITLTKLGRMYVNQWCQTYNLVNLIDARNQLHVNWLQALKFMVRDGGTINGFPVLQFMRLKVQ